MLGELLTAPWRGGCEGEPGWPGPWKERPPRRAWVGWSPPAGRLLRGLLAGGLGDEPLPLAVQRVQLGGQPHLSGVAGGLDLLFCAAGAAAPGGAVGAAGGGAEHGAALAAVQRPQLTPADRFQLLRGRPDLAVQAAQVGVTHGV